MSEIRQRESAADSHERQVSLPFDQYQRYRIVADALKRFREDGRPLRVLDVGGAEGIILRFLPDDEVTILDQAEAEDVPGFVLGDATALPFSDEEFDVVVSVDTFEHIAPEDRETFLSELRRTARVAVLLAAPFDSEEVRGAEKAVNEFHRVVHGMENVWLSEHKEHGLPSLDDAGRFFDERGDEVARLPNGYLPHWLAMICLTFQKPKLEQETANAFDAINAFYNEFLYRYDNAEPCYRYLLVCRKDAGSGASAEPVDSGGSASTNSGSRPPESGIALFGALPLALPMAAEVERLSRRLAEQERNRAQFDFESERKEAQIADLTRRLAELVGAENVRRTKYDQQRRTADDLEQKNARLRRQASVLQRQLAEIQGSRTWRLLSMRRRISDALGGARGSDKQ